MAFRIVRFWPFHILFGTFKRVHLVFAFAILTVFALVLLVWFIFLTYLTDFRCYTVILSLISKTACLSRFRIFSLVSTFWSFAFFLVFDTICLTWLSFSHFFLDFQILKSSSFEQFLLWAETCSVFLLVYSLSEVISELSNLFLCLSLIVAFISVFLWFPKLSNLDPFSSFSCVYTFLVFATFFVYFYLHTFAWLFSSSPIRFLQINVSQYL